MARPKFEPTPEQREHVKNMATVALNHDHMAAKLKIAPKTLRKHFRQELDQGFATGNFQLSVALFKKAMSGDTKALIYMCKVRRVFEMMEAESAQPTVAPFIVNGQERPTAPTAPNPDRSKEQKISVERAA